MTHNLTTKPHQGALICERLFHTSQLKLGLIQCAGLVSLIAYSDPISLNPHVYTRISINKLITLVAYNSMHMLKQQEDGFLWNINHDTSTNCLINGESIHYLQFSVPTEHID